MSIQPDFWKTKKLEEMSLEEWEALCDGCGICCLFKVENADTGQVELTNVACRFLDRYACRCQLYDAPAQNAPAPDRDAALPHANGGAADAGVPGAAGGSLVDRARELFGAQIVEEP